MAVTLASSLVLFVHESQSDITSLGSVTSEGRSQVTPTSPLLQLEHLQFLHRKNVISDSAQLSSLLGGKSTQM